MFRHRSVDTYKKLCCQQKHMDLQSHNDTTHQQIETAKKLVKNSDSLELKKPDGYKTIDEIEQFGNLIIEHDGFLEHGFGGIMAVDYLTPIDVFN